MALPAPDDPLIESMLAMSPCSRMRRSESPSGLISDTALPVRDRTMAADHALRVRHWGGGGG